MALPTAKPVPIANAVPRIPSAALIGMNAEGGVGLGLSQETGPAFENML